MAEITYYIKVFIAVFVLVNPLEGIPLFLNRTSSLTKEQKSAIAKKTATAVLVVLLIALFVGKYLLELLAIGIPAFSVGGGTIIFIIALQMVLGTPVKPGADSGNSDIADFAIVPLAIPLLAGPGPISSLILYGSQTASWFDYVMLTCIVLLVATGVYLSLNAAAKMLRYLGTTGMNVLTKVSGLLVAAIAVELIAEGLKQLF